MTRVGHRWFAVCAEKMQEVRVAQELTARITYAVDNPDEPFAWTESIGDGRVQWTAGANPDADAALTWPDAAIAHAVVTRRMIGDAANLVTTMVDRRSSRTYKGPPPPLDQHGEPALAEMQRVDGANLRLSCEYTDGPFGNVHCVDVFEDGVCVRVEPGADADAEAAVSFSFVNLMRLRAGSISVLDAFQEGRIAGSQGALALLAGLTDSTAFKRAMLATTTGGATDALAVLAQVAAAPSYRAALDTTTEHADA